MIDVLYLLDLVEAQVQTGQLRKCVKPFDMRDEVIVKVQVFERRAESRRKLDMGDLVLAQTQFLRRLSISTRSRSLGLQEAFVPPLV